MIPEWSAVARGFAVLTATLAVHATAIAADFAPAPQAPPSQEELVKLRDAKKADAVFAGAEWTFDYEAARRRAEAEKKLIFAYFTRSFAD